MRTAAMAVATMALAAASFAADLTITTGAIDTQRTIRPLLGVNAGPSPSGEKTNPDVTRQYSEIGVTLVRTHDFYGALDMSKIYPDRTKDPSNQASYDFGASDTAFAAIVNAGFEPYFRLGDSYNDAKAPANAAERSNWVKAAVEVLRHFREGKWNGFTSSFRYVEVWNEPDNKQFWPSPRTREEFFQLFAEAVPAIKAAFPALKVGGPGLTPAGFLSPQGQSWTQGFLQYMQQHAVPLDFFSWHVYSNDPDAWSQGARFYRSLLDSYGYRGAESHISEWNTEVNQSTVSSDATALRTGGRGASIMTAAWIRLQEEDVSVSAVYRGNDTSMNLTTFYGIFYADGTLKRTALAFSLWADVAEYSQWRTVSLSGAGTADAAKIVALAGTDGHGRTALLISNPTSSTVSADVRDSAGSISRMHVAAVTDSYTSTAHWSQTAPQLSLEPYSVMLVSWVSSRTRPAQR